jgi:hypothetical protein
MLEERDTHGAWRAAADAYSSQVLGPHLEHLARVWTARFSGDRWGAPLGQVGPAVVNDPKGRRQHEIDVVGIERGRRQHDQEARLVVLGEAKSTNRRRTTADLRRLEHLREILGASGRDAAGAHFALFSRTGFDDNLVDEASRRDDVHLVTLDDLYADDR